MVSLMNRSIDMLEELAHESNNVFHLSRRGYLFVTADPARIPDFERAAEEPCSLGAGPLRIHTGQPGESLEKRIASAVSYIDKKKQLRILDFNKYPSHQTKKAERQSTGFLTSSLQRQDLPSLFYELFAYFELNLTLSSERI
jgi:hypothetical protein